MAKEVKNMLGKAIRLASDVHSRQEDKGGKPYILHPLRVMMRLRTDDEELMSIAVMHDVIEDSSMTLDELYGMGFPQRVIDALRLLTHVVSVSHPYMRYIQDLATNEDARLIKIEDLRDNSDITRLKGVGAKDIARMEKYHRAYVFLTTK